MAWLFAKKADTSAVLAAGEQAVAAFEQEKAKLEIEKDSQMHRQVEIWSVSSADSSQGLEAEYKKAATGVAYNVKRILCLDEHIKKVRMGIFHAKNGDATRLAEILKVTDPCANIKPDVPDVTYQVAPSPVTQ